ncbi:MAG: hypothetical protein JXB88_26120 [Spirochaetales bacterium]|nr:hypothetical protein [Spirochaetales bacterium]
MPEIMFFKAGKYDQGNWPKERVQRMVDAYNPDKNIEAPIVIGHRDFMGSRLPMDTDEAQYAHGWVKSLRMDNIGKVYAEIPELSAEVLAAIAQKKLKYVSAEIFKFDEINPDDPPYLRAIALLGRDTPAVVTAKLPSFFSMFAGGTITSIDETKHLITFTCKLNISESPNTDISPSPAKQTGDNQSNINKESTMTETEKLTQELEKTKAELDTYKQENETLKASAGRKDAETFFSKLRDNGNLPPALFDRAVALDQKLSDDVRKEYRNLVSAFEKKVNMDEDHNADKKKADSIPETDEELSAKIRAFQAERGIESFLKAAEILFQEKPGLFKEGGKE